jgi:hypothetical protein
MKYDNKEYYFLHLKPATHAEGAFQPQFKVCPSKFSTDHPQSFFNLLAPEFDILILAHPVCKM